MIGNDQLNKFLIELYKRIHGKRAFTNLEKDIDDNEPLFIAEFGNDGVKKFSLLPPTMKRKKGRVFQKFGNNRFLLIDVFNAKRAHLEKLGLIPKDRESTWIFGRQYNLLGIANKFMWPQTYILFAEKGLGIAKDLEFHVDYVRGWSIPKALNSDIDVKQEYEFMSYNFMLTVPSGKLPSGCLKISNDIISSNGRNILTKSYGLISRNLINYVWQEYKLAWSKMKSMDEENGEYSCPYTSFQGQVGGYVGIWVLDTTLGNELTLICRKSQLKYNLIMQNMIDSEAHYDDLHNTFEILRWNGGPSKGILYGRMIQLLEHRGSSFEIMKRYVKPCFEVRVQYAYVK